jgi:hypothetical protein
MASTATWLLLAPFSGIMWVSGASLAELPVSTITLEEYQQYTKHSYSAFAAPFNAGSLIRGKDYVDAITVHPATFPADTLMSWTWPSDPCPIGICNFVSIQYGNYYNTHPETPISSRKIKEIATLTEVHGLTLGGSLQGFDVIIDFFLTSEPGGDSVHAFEIEIFLHTPRSSVWYMNHLLPIGTYKDNNGVVWRAAIDAKAKDILFMPIDKADVLSADIDLKTMLLWLVSRGTITGNEYFSGLATGAEVKQDFGSLLINSFSVTYD